VQYRVGGTFFGSTLGYGLHDRQAVYMTKKDLKVGGQCNIGGADIGEPRNADTRNTESILSLHPGAPSASLI
jgi:hypothetical protein